MIDYDTYRHIHHLHQVDKRSGRIRRSGDASAVCSPSEPLDIQSNLPSSKFRMVILPMRRVYTVHPTIRSQIFGLTGLDTIATIRTTHVAVVGATS